MRFPSTPDKPDTPDQRLARARRSLNGLAVGDGFGQSFKGPIEDRIATRTAPPPPWRVSDDTIMAEAIVDVLAARGEIDQDLLAREFGKRFLAEPERGYGAVAYWMLHQMAHGMPWREASRQVFGGQGSMGNGGAMRAAPLGAYFADDLPTLISEARASAAVTHAHPEGQAGAIAVAVAAAYASISGDRPDDLPDEDLLKFVADQTPKGETRDGILRARRLSRKTTVAEAAQKLGSGHEVLSRDTVPFALWCAQRHLGSFEEALWAGIAGLGDVDTVGAIVGGVVALNDPPPATWLAAAEPRPR